MVHTHFAPLPMLWVAHTSSLSCLQVSLSIATSPLFSRTVVVVEIALYDFYHICFYAVFSTSWKAGQLLIPVLCLALCPLNLQRIHIFNFLPYAHLHHIWRNVLTGRRFGTMFILEASLHIWILSNSTVCSANANFSWSWRYEYVEYLSSQAYNRCLCTNISLPHGPD